MASYCHLESGSSAAAGQSSEDKKCACFHVAHCSWSSMQALPSGLSNCGQKGETLARGVRRGLPLFLTHIALSGGLRIDIMILGRGWLLLSWVRKWQRWVKFPMLGRRTQHLRASFCAGPGVLFWLSCIYCLVRFALSVALFPVFKVMFSEMEQEPLGLGLLIRISAHSEKLQSVSLISVISFQNYPPNLFVLSILP